MLGLIGLWKKKCTIKYFVLSSFMKDLPGNDKTVIGDCFLWTVIKKKPKKLFQNDSEE